MTARGWPSGGPGAATRRSYRPSDSEAPAKTFDNDVDDLRSVIARIRDLTGRRPHLIGASYGAWTSLHLACAEEEAVRSLVLFEPPLFAAGPPSQAVLPASVPTWPPRNWCSASPRACTS